MGRVVGLLPLVLLLAACSAGPTDDERDGVRALVGADKSGGRDAMIAGRVRLTEGRCLGLDPGDGRRMLVVWPAGVTLLPDGRPGVNVPDLGEVVVGDQIEAGGGYEASPPEGFDASDVADCAAEHPEVAVIDDRSTLRRASAPTPSRTPPAGGVRAVVAPPGPPAGLWIQGDLVLTDAWCLAVVVDGRPYVVVWPAGVTPTGDGVDVPGVGRLVAGDVLRAAGGYPARSDVPADCGGAGAAVIDSVETIERG